MTFGRTEFRSAEVRGQEQLSEAGRLSSPILRARADTLRTKEANRFMKRELVAILVIAAIVTIALLSLLMIL